MTRLDAAHEFALVDALVRDLPRNPDQVNAAHEADAELLARPGGHLAVNMDCLQEEVEVGLLRDPEAIGWCLVAHSLSDLAAVAARPLGVMLAYTLPLDADEAWRQGLQRGVRAALEAHGTGCLGGDTSAGPTPSFQCCALGWVEGDRYLTRRGAQAGDVLLATGPFGAGIQLGVARRVGDELGRACEAGYRPRAQLEAGAAMAELARACVDSSDGLFAALHVLTGVNQLGLRLDLGPAVFLPGWVQLASRARLPLWFGAAFGMGEYQLLFAVPPEQEGEAVARLEGQGLGPVRLGTFTAEPTVRATPYRDEVSLDLPRFVNLLGESGSIDEYVAALLALDVQLGGTPPAGTGE